MTNAGRRLLHWTVLIMCGLMSLWASLFLVRFSHGMAQILAAFVVIVGCLSICSLLFRRRSTEEEELIQQIKVEKLKKAIREIKGEK
jgi:hypothetical protein